MFGRRCYKDWVALVSFTARHLANCQVMRMVLPTWFDRLKESSSCKEIQFKMFWLLVKISCPPAENVNEIPGAGLGKVFEGQSLLRPFGLLLCGQLDYMIRNIHFTEKHLHLSPPSPPRSTSIFPLAPLPPPTTQTSLIKLKQWGRIAKTLYFTEVGFRGTNFDE